METIRTPALTVDIVIELQDRPERPIVLIERKYEPLGWALPGGFVDLGETVEQAAVREAKEETNLAVTLMQLLGCYSDPMRDQRRHTVSLVYIAQASGAPIGCDDAKRAQVVSPFEPPPLVFDHALILQDYQQYRTEHRLTPLRFR